MLSNYRTIIIPKYRILFFIFSIIRYNNDKDLPSVLPSNSESLLDILILDFSLVVVNSGILYKSNALAFLAAIVTLRFLFYLILYNRCYFIFFFLILDFFRYRLYF